MINKKAKICFVAICIILLSSSTTFSIEHTTFDSPLPHKVYIPSVMCPTCRLKGIAPNYATFEDWKKVGATWGYIYSANAGLWDNSEGIDIIPMLNVTYGHITDTITGNSQWLMGFNEFDLQGPTPYNAAILWHDYAEKSGRKLVSPSIVAYYWWLDNMRSEYYNLYGTFPRFDALAVHCYEFLYWMQGVTCQTWVSSMVNRALEWGVPEVWVTEFSYQTPEAAIPFIEWMKTNSKITRYAWYTNRLKGDEPWAYGWYGMTLFNWDGTITPFGQMYAER